MQMKQMETQAAQAREHQQRMAEQARLDREAAREAADRREKLEREAREEAERARQRQHEMELKRLEAQQQADREHAERMMTLTKMQNSGGLSGLTDMLGMETPELLGRIFGGDGEDGGGGWSETLAKVVGAAAEAAKTVAKQGTGPLVERPKAQGGNQNLIPIQTANGVRMLTVDQVRELRARQEQQRQPPTPMPATPFVPGLPPGAIEDTPQSAESVPAPAEEEPTSEALPAEEASSSAQELSKDYQAAVGIDTTKRAKAGGLKLKEMRKARRALRKLAEQLDKAEEDEWEGIITAAVFSTPEIFGYIEAVSAYAAFVETKAEPELVERVIAALKASELVPEGVVPYNEADLVSFQEAKAAEAAAQAEANQVVHGVHGDVLARENTDEQEKEG